MRSASDGSDDLTTKARIRDTAISMIGRSGFTATTVRAIAAEVGVSPALLLHHFGSKDGLREVCNDHVLAWYAAQVDEIAQDDSPSSVIGMIERMPEMLPLAAYIRRSLVDGGTFARQIFDALVADTARYLDRSVASGAVRPTVDPHGRAALMVVTSLGAHLLAEYLSPPGTPTELQISAASEQLTLPGLELYTHGLFTDSGYLDTYRGWQQQHTGGAAPGRPMESSP